MTVLSVTDRAKAAAIGIVDHYPARSQPLAQPPAGSDLLPVMGDAGAPGLGYTLQVQSDTLKFAQRRLQLLEAANQLVPQQNSSPDAPCSADDRFGCWSTTSPIEDRSPVAISDPAALLSVPGTPVAPIAPLCRHRAAERVGSIGKP